MPAPRTLPLLLALVAPLAAQSATDIAVSQYRKDCARELADAGQRHLALGSWARKQGLVPQATAQFLRAVEVAKGNNPGAIQVLGIMRGYGDAFWIKKRARPPKAMLADFARRSEALETKDRAAHRDLAQQAARAHLDDESKEHWLEVLHLGGELACDDKGQWRLDGERISDNLVEWLQQRATKVNGNDYTFEIAAAAAPKLEHMVEVRSEHFSVRTDLSNERADQLLALASALWPILEDRLDGAPSRQLRLFVFSKRADFDGYLAARKLAPTTARGLADYGGGQTLVCAEGLGDPELQAITLHELTHLFFYGTAPAVMPDWYAEGFAETFGGQGTFTWDGKVLATGGLLRKDRLTDLQKNPIPLAELLAADAAQQLAADAQKGLRFYAESWALVRFLQQPDCPWNARFLHFEQKCRGQVLGAPDLKAKYGSREPAAKVWKDLFGQDQGKLEAAFLAWLTRLRAD